MQRIAIIGSSGAGKSTLARELGAILGLEVVHLDVHYWQPGWVPTPEAEWDRINRELVQKEQWIIDGNYSRTMEVRMAAADTIIYLDLPRWLCVWRVLKRTLLRLPRPDLATGCQERLGIDTLRFLKWIWDYPQRSRSRTLQRLQKYATGRETVILHNTAEVKRFLTCLRRQNEPAVGQD